MRQRETACVCIFEIVKNWRTRFNSRKFVNLAGFIRRVSIGMHYLSVHDLNDGFEGRTGACREYALPCEDPESEITAWIDGHTRIGFKLRLHALWTSTESKFRSFPHRETGSKSLVVISRGSNHYVEKSRYNDPDYSPESRELANCRSTEETRASQPKTQSNPMGDHSEDFIPIGERKWERDSCL